MFRNLVLAAIVVGACTPDPPTPSADAQLMRLGGLDPWVRMKCKSTACEDVVLTARAASSGTYKWLHPDGTTTTGTTITVATPDPDSPFVMEVEITYDNGDTGQSAVAIAATRKRYLGEEEPDPTTELIVAEVRGDDCGVVVISSIGGCFGGADPFTFSLWDGLADPNVTDPYAAMPVLAPAAFNPFSTPVGLTSGGATAARAYDNLGVIHEEPPGEYVPEINEVPPYMSIKIDQATLPAITVLPIGSQGTTSWTSTEALTFQCGGSDPFDELATIPAD